MIRRMYTTLAAALVRLIVAYCTTRKRYVDYVHTRRTLTKPHTYREQYVYMRRYVLFGYRTGDPKQTGWRAWLPSLYLHHMHAPDADTALHNHPFPWGLSFVLLGGYREERLHQNTIRTFAATRLGLIEYVSRIMQIGMRVYRVERTHTAPAFNYIPGGAFHRVAEIETPAQLEARGALWYKGRAGRRAPEGGTWTLFLAGPRRHNKPWGYLVPGRGYVDQKIRHAELGASEVRA